MSVDRRASDRFEKNHAQARRSARDKLEFVLANKESLLALRNGEKLLRDAGELLQKVTREELTPNQYQYVEDMIEAVWKSQGLPSVDRHRDRKFSMRHPK
jgi:hypothetical protein